ncbi:hypothetical protein Bbelb_389860 [Branchiostoma belcheri]|nr:hypothetical protein Bbelb_389860 [Branchiostoma belcheri]
MSGVIPSPKQQSTVINQSLKDPKNAQAVSTFRALVQSCYGPTGRLKMIHNASGGHVTSTSMSQTLFRSMSVSNPVVKLIVSAVQSHTNQFSDGGLFAALLCSCLIESWDSDEFIDTAYEADVGVSGDALVFQHLMQVAAHLVQLQVGVLACQKVVHPGVQKYLAENGVLTVDRLGSLHVVAVQRLTGATAIGTLHAAINEDSIGHLHNISTVQIQHKNYLHLQSSTSPVNTLLLCNRNEAALLEMKDVCRTAHHVLCQALRTPLVLCGGGCTETHLAAHLRAQVTMQEETLLAKLGCSKAQLHTTANNFARCLEQVAMALEHDGGCHVSDPVNHHHWLLPPWASTTVPAETGVETCACGMVKTDKIDSVSCSPIGHLSDQSQPSSGSKGHGKHCDDKSNCSASLTDYMDQATQKLVESGPNVVLDSFPVKLNVFVVAVETANMILTVNRTIFDKN